MSLLTLGDSSPLQSEDMASPTPSVFPLPMNQQQLLSPISLSSNQSQFTTPRASVSSQRQTPRLPPPNPGSNVSNQSYRTAPSQQVSNISNYQNPQKDFGYLLRPEIYHPLTLLDVPPPVRVSSLQPSPDTPLPALIQSGHFRSAAIKAAQQLTSNTVSPADHAIIFPLIYARLSCLTLCNATSLAAQEVKALEDLNSIYYLDDTTGEHLAPWELRVLAVRLQGMGFNDARRGVMGYYDLGREARLALTSLKADQETNEKEIAMWEARLEDLGLRVASALIETDDLDGASRHLKLLGYSKGLRMQKALLWLYLGDVDAARSCVPRSADAENAADAKGEKIILALASMGDGDYATAIPVWEELISSSEDKDQTAMYRQNLAVCLLYLGQLPQARTHLEALVDSRQAWKGITFNLATIYELCTERSRALKIGLVEKIAGQKEERMDRGVEGEAVGYDGVNGDFKL
jgi:tetratricopeptide (TPR) repeat protein